MGVRIKDMEEIFFYTKNNLQKAMIAKIEKVFINTIYLSLASGDKAKYVVENLKDLNQEYCFATLKEGDKTIFPHHTIISVSLEDLKRRLNWIEDLGRTR